MIGSPLNSAICVTALRSRETHVLQVRVPVSHCFPLEQAPEAFKALMSRDAVGKVLLTPQPGGKLAAAKL